MPIIYTRVLEGEICLLPPSSFHRSERRRPQARYWRDSARAAGCRLAFFPLTSPLLLPRPTLIRSPWCGHTWPVLSRSSARSDCGETHTRKWRTRGWTDVKLQEGIFSRSLAFDVLGAFDKSNAMLIIKLCKRKKISFLWSLVA